ncbi:ferredoxin [Riemerella anatipestifer]|nr:ferredoxin [Riemerella anatipestifer]
MVIVTLQRDKCIGCNYCASLLQNTLECQKDGKSVR